MSKPPILQKVASKSTVALGAKLLSFAIIYATHLVLARLYGAEMMGTFFIASNLVFLLGTACTLGLDKAMLRFAASLQEEGRTSLVSRLSWGGGGLIVVLCSFLAIVLYLGRVRLSVWLNAIDLPPMLPFFLLALPLFALGTIFRETLRGLGSVLWATLSQYVIQPGLLLGLIVFLYLLNPAKPNQGTELSLAFCFSILLTLAIVLWRLKLQNNGAPPKAIVDHSLWRSLLKYSWPIFLYTILQSTVSIADSLILALFRLPQEVAYYGSAIKLTNLVTLPLLAINAVVPPLFVQFYQRHDMAQLENLARITSRWMYYFSLPFCLGLILLSSEILTIFGPGFQSARWCLIFMAIGQLLCSTSGSVFNLLFMTGNQQKALNIRSWTLVFTLPLMFWLAYKYGANGLGLARAIGIAFPNILAIWLVWKVMGIKTFAEDIVPITVSACVALGLAWAIRYRFEAFWAAISFGIVYLMILSGVIWHRKEWRLLQAISAK